MPDPILSPLDGYVTDFRLTPEAIDVGEIYSHYRSQMPWKNPKAIKNSNGAIVIDAGGIRLRQAEISQVDKFGRQIDIGSFGIMARDASGNIIHDISIPESNSEYVGHLHYLADDTLGYVVFYEDVGTMSSPYTDNITDATINLAAFRPAFADVIPANAKALYGSIQFEVYGTVAASSGTLKYIEKIKTRKVTTGDVITYFERSAYLPAPDNVDNVVPAYHNQLIPYDAETHSIRITSSISITNFNTISTTNYYVAKIIGYYA